MKRSDKYSLRDLKQDFPSDASVLDLIFQTIHSSKCSCGGSYKPIKGRKQYQCSRCRYQISPTAGTIFHKSDTPLTLWLWAIFIFSSAKSGISAKELERQLGVTYKTAWRMLMLIRKALPQGSDLLSGEVEMDETTFGGKTTTAKKSQKPFVVGAVERGGRVRAKVMKESSRPQSIYRFIKENVGKEGTTLYTDSWPGYSATTYGFKREKVNHSKKKFVRGKAHVNSVEGFWSHVKRSVTGTHKVISRKHLPSYLDGFVFHWNNRHSDRERFSSLLGALLQPSK